MTGLRRGLAAGALVVVGGCALVGGMTIAVLSVLALIRAAAPTLVSLTPVRVLTPPVPASAADYAWPSVALIAGVTLLLAAWVALIAAATRAWPDRRNRSIGPPDLSDDAERLLTGE